VHAEFDLNAKYAGDFLTGQSNARLLAMGGVGVAVGQGTAAMMANPALLSPQSRQQIALMHVDRFNGMVKVDHAVYVQGNPQNRAIGVAVLRQGVDDIPLTELMDPNSPISGDNRVRVLGSASASEYAFQFGYAMKRPFGLIGANAKLLYKDMHDEFAVGLGVDIGYAYQYGNLMIGGQLRNALASILVWSTGRQEAILPSARLGLAYRIDAERLMAEILPAAELEVRGESLDDPDAFVMHLGLEYQIRRTISARVGFDDERLTYGAGLVLGLVDLDYAFVGHSDLGATHRISLSFSWGLPR